LEAQPDTGVPQWDLADRTQASSLSHTQDGTFTSQYTTAVTELGTGGTDLGVFEFNVLTPV
ncbi:hypothetical protein, partial [Klebsiella pneumoniae]|uniref:hypothetical protein n=1 Tax=Klebsiella pneumoniae TaxID=573 RepID=UPI001D0DD7C8